MSTDNKTLDQIKEEHMNKANSYIRNYVNRTETLQNKELKSHLLQMVDALRDLRETQYVFDSGEHELDLLYDKYLPYLDKILEEYRSVSTAVNYSEVRNVREKLYSTIDTMTSTIYSIKELLPQDEISAAKAEADARRMKEELEEKYKTSNEAIVHLGEIMQKAQSRLPSYKDEKKNGE